MPKYNAILLAAGLSTRMGAANKLLLPWGAQTVIEAVAATYLAAIDGTLTVVTGHEAEHVQAALSGLDVQFAHNPNYAQGQPTSVATGLKAAPQSDNLLIGLGDQPLLTPTDLATLMTAHNKINSRITIPVQGEDRGNPIVVPATLRPRLTENPDRPGCMRFTREHPECVARLPMTSPGFFTDIDTPEAYAALANARKDIPA